MASTQPQESVVKVKDYRNLNWQKSSASSTGGQYLKAEKLVDGKRYYLKLSDFSYGTFLSHEAVLEVIASRLGILLGFPVLKYTGSMAKVMIDGEEYTTYVVRSLDYCKVTEAAMPIVTDYELNKQDEESPIEYGKRIGLTEYMDYLFLFDYLICNVDRHGRNIELLYKGNSMCPAPIFDSGRCLTFQCGNRIENILKWDYTESGMGNSFFGSIYLENNLNYVSKQYALPRLTEESFKSIFFGLSSVLQKEHLQILKKGITYRYQKMIEKGVVV